MYSFGGFLTKMGVKIFHYKPSSYWGTPIFENPYLKKTQIPNGHPGPLNPLPKSLKRFWRASTSATIPWVAPGEEMPWHMRQEPISTYFNIFPPFSIPFPIRSRTWPLLPSVPPPGSDRELDSPTVWRGSSVGSPPQRLATPVSRNRFTQRKCPEFLRKWCSFVTG